MGRLLPLLQQAGENQLPKKCSRQKFVGFEKDGSGVWTKNEWIVSGDFWHQMD
jgi:hypothetical protein